MAQPEKAIIRSLFDPEIVLDTIDIGDVDNASYRGGPEVPQTEQLGGDLGVRYPYITINGYVFQLQEIIEMRIDSNSLIPTIYLEVQLAGSGAFSSQAFPKDGDLINLFVRARNDVWKPIRNDYIITGVDQSGGDTDGSGSRIVFNGTLFIPGLYDEEIRSYEGTSFEVLQKIAQELKLGFATNESSTADEMIWICPNENYSEMIQHIQGSMWKDDQSFYLIFIDVYYHLNVINVNNQFSDGSEIDTALMDQLSRDTFFKAAEGPQEEYQKEAPKCFINFDRFQNTPNYIVEYQVRNNASEISQRHGYKTQVSLFDMNSLEPWEFDIDPINTAGSGQDKIILKGRGNPKGVTPNADFWKTQNKRRYLGVQYSKPEHNVHDKYLYAKLFHSRNNLELDKLYIEIETEGFNLNIYRGERIPCIFMVQEKDPQQQQFTRADDQDIDPEYSDPTVSQFYSGYYMLGGMTFEYSQGKKNAAYLHQKITLRRREWPMP
jgi:hypothetical protein